MIRLQLGRFLLWLSDLLLQSVKRTKARRERREAPAAFFGRPADLTSQPQHPEERRTVAALFAHPPFAECP